MRWCAVWVAAIVLLAGVSWLNQRYYRRVCKTVAVKEVACKPITTASRDNKRMRDQVRRFEHHETLVGQLRDDKPALTALAAVSRCAELCEGQIVVRDLRFEQRTGRFYSEKQEKEAIGSGSEGALTIEGDALDNVAIARFAAGLRDAALFRDVELKSSVGKPSSDRSIHSFIVRCEM